MTSPIRTTISNVHPVTIADVAVPNGSSVAIVAATPANPAFYGVTIKALAANTNKVRAGDALISATRGIELSAGDSITFPESDPSKLFVWGVGAGSSVCVSWV